MKNDKKSIREKLEELDLSEESVEEIKLYLKEKERIRKLIGAIGGKPKKRAVVVNWVFGVFVIAFFIGALALHGIERLISIEVGILLVSLKLIYFLHNEAKVNHFQFWILSTLEWKIGEIDSKIRKIEKILEAQAAISEDSRVESKEQEIKSEK